MDALKTREAVASIIAVICAALVASNVLSPELAEAVKTVALAAIPSIIIFIANKFRNGGVPFRPLPPK